MPRPTSTAVSANAGCFQCNGNIVLWDGPNAQAVAARHHDATGHTTWVNSYLSIQYGPDLNPQPCPTNRETPSSRSSVS